MAASGARDFDFIFGRWRVHNRKLRNVADPACEEWVEFDAVVGRFTGNHGVFDCEDIIGGHAVKVRFEWHADEFSPTWLQSFSYDSGSTWKPNWEMTLSRDFEAGSQDDAAAISPSGASSKRSDRA